MIASVPLVAGVLLLGWRPQPTVPVDERAYVATTVAVGGGERAAALQLYAAGQFPGACERFSRAAADNPKSPVWRRSEEHTSELQSPCNLVCRLLLEKKKKKKYLILILKKKKNKKKKI